jgi:hypothetical protein
MNKLFFIPIFAAILASCATNYKIQNSGAHIIVDDNEKYYVNDSLGLSVQLNLNDYDYTLKSSVNHIEKRILRKVNFLPKFDTLIFAGKDEILILKNKYHY